MNDPKFSKKYVMAKGPVNRRTTPPGPAPRGQEAPLVKVRMQIAKARQRLGTPLSQRLTAARSGSTLGKHLSAKAILLTIGCAVSATGLLLGLIQNSLLIASTSAALLCGFIFWAYVATKAGRKEGGNSALEITNIVATSDIEYLDAAMEKLATEAPQETVDRLASMKESITRCVTSMTSTQIDGGFSTEDHLYVRECVRRYIPDSISSYLQVPKKDRASLVIDDNKSALDLLHDQIDMIQSQLDTKEIRLTQVAGESLMRQQRFLTAKTNTKN